MTKKKTEKRDGRLALILFFGYFFILSFAVPKAAVYHEEMVGDGDFDLETALIAPHSTPSVIPANLTPFFFKKLPINNADKELLMTIKGVGPKLAESIIDSRAHKGPFHNSADLLDIKGVGRKRAMYFTTVFSYRVTDDQSDK